MIRLLGRLPVAPFIACLFGGVAATLLAAAPIAQLEYWAHASGLAARLPLARAPIGANAHLLGAALSGLGLGLFLYFAVRLIDSWSARPHRAVPVRPWSASIAATAAINTDVHSDAAYGGSAPEVPNNLIDLAQLPRFLCHADADADADAEHDGELLLESVAPDIATPTEAEPALSASPLTILNRPRLTLVPDKRSVEPPQKASAAVYMPQPDPVLFNAPPPVLPPETPMKLPAEAEPLSVAETSDLTALIERLQRGLAYRGSAPPSPADDAVLRAAILQLDALMVAPGR